jgi:hypothetical protein
MDISRCTIKQSRGGGAKHIWNYARGTNRCESLNNVMEIALPKKCGKETAALLMQIIVTGHNIKMAVQHLGSPDPGHCDVLLSVKVCFALQIARSRH